MWAVIKNSFLVSFRYALVGHDPGQQQEQEELRGADRTTQCWVRESRARGHAGLPSEPASGVGREFRRPSLKEGTCDVYHTAVSLSLLVKSASSLPGTETENGIQLLILGHNRLHEFSCSSPSCCWARLDRS